jgi:hypothetical protein
MVELLAGVLETFLLLLIIPWVMTILQLIKAARATMATHHHPSYIHLHTFENIKIFMTAIMCEYISAHVHGIGNNNLGFLFLNVPDMFLRFLCKICVKYSHFSIQMFLDLF